MDPDYIIDNQGELIIAILNPNAPFAVWENADCSPVTENNSPQSPAASEVTDTAMKNPKADERGEPKTVRIRASAKHLSHASPVFKALLKDKIVNPAGPIELTVHDWDVKCFLLFLRILHGQSHKIPQWVTVEQLAKVTVMADHYDCEKVVRSTASRYIEFLEYTMPITYSRETILWIWLGFFFRLSRVFESCTSIAMEDAPGLISSLGLPIPDKIIDLMNKLRINGISKVLETLYQQHDFYLQDETACPSECKDIMLGALARQLHARKLLFPRPVPPYVGHKYGSLRKVKLFRSPLLLEERYQEDQDGLIYRLHNCETSDFGELFAHLDSRIFGLELGNYIR
ncbi:hypothetical protein BJX61DRAFT_544043 [Aspergillus egyptiacus]|nr:hypothetical protein BJX61DRAFT_544043 [Aspergillus egyptiacus]